MRPRWIQVNLYPQTRKGRSSLVIWENVGYQWKCEGHAKVRCKACANFDKRTILRSDTASPVEYRGDLVQLLLDLVVELEPDRAEVDDEGRRVVFYSE